MGAAPEKHLGLWLVFVSGVLAGVYGIVLILLERHVDEAVAVAAGGLALVAWVIFHPARAAAVRR
jgi:hypothetical protein